MTTIDNVQVRRSAKGKLDVIIPAGMTGSQLSAWRKKNAAAITESTGVTIDAPKSDSSDSSDSSDDVVGDRHEQG